MILQNSIAGIHSFLKKWIVTHKGFQCRSFYGETFTLAFFALIGEKSEKVTNILKDEFFKLDTKNPEFHWEFNRYALNEYQKLSGDQICKLDQFKGTPCTNWTLLRNRLVYNPEEVKNKINEMQLSNGLILDDPEVHSLQYHCFSLALIIEIYEEQKDPFLLQAFEKGVTFIRSMILSNGDTLYIGRGQQQLFGYAALIYILSKATLYFNDSSLFAHLEQVIHFLSQFQRKDGSFPLVLREGETEIPKKADVKNPAFSGWYPYNNYFDYLPFAGYFLAKAATSIKPESICYSPNSFFDGMFQKVVKPNYQAVLAKPTGYFSNDLAFPYLVSNGKTLTPAYGGEQFEESLFSPLDLPLPYFPDWGRGMRWKSRAIFQRNRLIMFSPLGVMIRDFTFSDAEIEVKTRILSPFKVRQQYLFFESIEQDSACSLSDHRLTIVSNKPLEYERKAYSASGPLKLFSCRGKLHQLKVKVSL